MPLLVLLALGYAIFAGIRTVDEQDLGWQLATGRWMIQHHSVPFTDVFSYTAYGQEWIYPVLSQLLLYCVYQLGGYSLLSWFGAAACVGTTTILLRRCRIASASLAVLAVPMIANRTSPRADMFTVVLFAAFVSILWHYHRSGSAPLWLLPPVMFLWANLHLGFVAGLAMLGGYVALECGEAISSRNRRDALLRLRRAAPWLIFTACATLLNPWGIRIYLAIVRQNALNALHGKAISEWVALPLTTARLDDLLAWREPRSALVWFLLVAVVSAVIAVVRSKFAPALLLAAAAYLVIHAMRFEALFAILVVVIAGSLLEDALESEWIQKFKSKNAQPGRRFALRLTICVFALVFVGLVTIRMWDLASNRYYLRTATQVSAFGPGESYWYPEQAADFLLQWHLPANIFNDYTLGGFFAWKLYPSYSDYIDGRAVPFTGALFLRSLELLGQTLDSPEWQEEASNRKINTVFVSLDHRLGSPLTSIGQFCASRQWRPVYLDPHGAVFLRVTPGAASEFDRLQLDCSAVTFDNPPTTSGSRGKVERFNYYLNAATILVVLNRFPEALNSLDQASRIFSENGYLHYTRGIALHNLRRWPEAEQEWIAAMELDSDDAAPLALATQYEQQGSFADAEKILERGANRSFQPYWLYLRLGYTQLQLGRPHDALDSFHEAEKHSPFMGDTHGLGASFYEKLAEGRRRAMQSTQFH